VTSTLEKSIAFGGTGERRMHVKGGGVEGGERWAGMGGTAGKSDVKGGGGSFF
jgi:hypothetical protein